MHEKMLQRIYLQKCLQGIRMDLSTTVECREDILSQEIYDYITDFPVSEFEGAGESFCYTNIENLYNIVYISRSDLTGLRRDIFEYRSTPKLYGLCPIEGSGTGKGFRPDALIATGSLQVQGSPLNLTGRGCVICFIGTGIDYTLDVFRDENGRSRILAIWDQTLQTGTPPEGFLYGSEYTREEIDRALLAEDPYGIVPSRDEIGHGTIMASAGAGSNLTGERAFLGAAPEADIVVVKLKPCKEYLRSLYMVPAGVPAYQENDIMLAVQYAEGFVTNFYRPVTICMGLGTNLGDHTGTSALGDYLNTVALRRSRAIVVAGGDEGNAAHHYRGRLENSLNTDLPDAVNEGNVEVRVAEGCNGFLLECWGKLPDTLQVGLRSPGGEIIPPVRIKSQTSLTYRLIYERAVISMDSTLVEPLSGDQVIRFRISDPTPGIWTFMVTAQGPVYNGIFDMWLPLSEFLTAPVYFLKPDPYITLTEPAYAARVISVTDYNPSNQSFAVNSGRGFSRNSVIRPDLAAPGVQVPAIRRRMTENFDGSAMGAALTAGAVTQLFQWTVVETRSLYAETQEIKSYLIRGADRVPNLTYPTREWGYGRLNLEGTFNALAT